MPPFLETDRLVWRAFTAADVNNRAHWFHPRPAGDGAVDLGYRLRKETGDGEVWARVRPWVPLRGRPRHTGAEQGEVEYALTRDEWLAQQAGPGE